MRAGDPTAQTAPRRGARLLSTVLSTLLVAAALAGLHLRGPQQPEVATAAGSTYLCTGYSGCRSAGYSDAGYGARNDRMYWRMYAGHNCTNYVAYRMIKAGMSPERPWSGSGMAYNWGHAMDHITDRTPAVGAVAWWDRYDNGTGSSGHVAYVEKVVSATEIIISQDSWGGDFSWRRVTKDSGRWPTGFIHFIDKSLTNVQQPAIHGTPQVGSELRASTGRWKPGAAEHRFQWYVAGTPIKGATAQTFVPAPEHRGKALTVEVTALKPDFTRATARSKPTAPVAPGRLVSGSAPTITGEALVDEVLTATPGAWTPRPDKISYRWRADGRMIKDQYERRLTLTRALVGKRISVETVARKAGYEKASVVSEPTEPVVLGEIQVAQPTAVEGTPHLGEVLTAVRGGYQPTDVQVAHQWLRDGAPIAGATAASYKATADDLGRVVSLQTTVTRRNYREVVETVEVGRVRTTPTVHVRANGWTRRAVVHVRVTAPGVRPVSGDVYVHVGRRVLHATLADGRARVVVPRLVPGQKTARVVYTGTDAVLRGTGTDGLTVRR